MSMLAPDVVWTADSDGKASAARRPVAGAERWRGSSSAYSASPATTAASSLPSTTARPRWCSTSATAWRASSRWSSPTGRSATSTRCAIPRSSVASGWRGTVARASAMLGRCAPSGSPGSPSPVGAARLAPAPLRGRPAAACGVDGRLVRLARGDRTECRHRAGRPSRVFAVGPGRRGVGRRRRLGRLPGLPRPRRRPAQPRVPAAAGGWTDDVLRQDDDGYWWYENLSDESAPDWLVDALTAHPDVPATSLGRRRPRRPPRGCAGLPRGHHAQARCTRRVCARSSSALHRRARRLLRRRRRAHRARARGVRHGRLGRGRVAVPRTVPAPHRRHRRLEPDQGHAPAGRSPSALRRRSRTSQRT